MIKWTDERQRTITTRITILRPFDKPLDTLGAVSKAEPLRAVSVGEPQAQDK